MTVREARWAANGIKFRGQALTEKGFDAILAIEGGRCPICERKETLSAVPFVPDHNHATGEVRGIVCRDCNRYPIARKEKFGYSYVMKNGPRLAELDERVEAYLRRPPAALATH